MRAGLNQSKDLKIKRDPLEAANVLTDNFGVRGGQKANSSMNIRLDDIVSQSSAHTPRRANIFPIATKTPSVFGGSPSSTTFRTESCLSAAAEHAQACESGGALGNTQVGFPELKSERSSRSIRYEMREGLRGFSSLNRVKRCGAVPLAGGVNLLVGADRASYGGLETCGSVWACPVCSARISAKRKTEVEQLITRAVKAGCFVSMLTLTQRHHQGQRLKDLWDGLSYAWNKVTSGRRWQEVREQLGLVGYLRAVEVTHGEHGWHVHNHILVISEKDPTITPVFFNRKRSQEVQMPSDFIADRWESGLARKGIDFLRHSGGLDWQVAKPGDEKTLGAYVAKLGVKQLTGREKIDGLAKETTLGGFKKARKGNRTPFQILEDFLRDGLEEDRQLWMIWEKASRGRRALTWSKGLRDWAGLGEELTDEQLAEETTGDETAATFDSENWRRLRAIGSGQLLDIVENHGIEAGYKWLRAHEISYRVPETLGNLAKSLGVNVSHPLAPPF